VPECLPLPALPSFLSSLVLLRQVRKSGVLGQTEGDEVAGEGLAIEESKKQGNMTHYQALASHEELSLFDFFGVGEASGLLLGGPSFNT